MTARRRGFAAIVTSTLTAVVVAPDMRAATDARPEALTDAVMSCLQQEGGYVHPRLRRAVLAHAQRPEVLAPLAKASCGGMADLPACADSLRTSGCAELSSQLPAVPLAGAPLAPFVKAVELRVLECFAIETRKARPESLPAREGVLRSVHAFVERIGEVMGALAASGECTLHPEVLPACVEALRTASCEDVGLALLPERRKPRLANEPAPSSPLSLCPALLSCGQNTLVVREASKK